MGEIHCYSDKKCFDAVKSVIQGTGYGKVYDLAIGITSQQIQEYSFNRHDHLSGVGIVTTGGADEYKPLSVPLEKFMTYLILCESCCIAGHTHFEHGVIHSCLFDMCYEKKDMIRCITEPKICKDCERDLRRAGFSKSDIDEVKKLLSYIKKPDIPYGIRKGFENPFAGFFLGSFLLMSFFRYVEEYVQIESRTYIIFLFIQILLIIIIVGVSGFGIKFKK